MVLDLWAESRSLSKARGRSERQTELKANAQQPSCAFARVILHVVPRMEQITDG